MVTHPQPYPLPLDCQKTVVILNLLSEFIIFPLCSVLQQSRAIQQLYNYRGMIDDYYERQEHVHSGPLNEHDLVLIGNTLNSIMSKANPKTLTTLQYLRSEMNLIFRQCRHPYFQVKAFNYQLTAELLLDFIKQDLAHLTINQQHLLKCISDLRLHHSLSARRDARRPSPFRSQQRKNKSPLSKEGAKKKKTQQIDSECEHQDNSKLKQCESLQKHYEDLIGNLHQKIQDLEAENSQLKNQTYRTGKAYKKLEKLKKSLEIQIKEKSQSSEEESKAQIKKKDQKIKSLKQKLKELQEINNEHERSKGNKNKEEHQSLKKKVRQRDQQFANVKAQYDEVVEQRSALMVENRMQNEEITKLKEILMRYNGLFHEYARETDYLFD